MRAEVEHACGQRWNTHAGRGGTRMRAEVEHACMFDIVSYGAVHNQAVAPGAAPPSHPKDESERP